MLKTKQFYYLKYYTYFPNNFRKFNVPGYIKIKEICFISVYTQLKFCLYFIKITFNIYKCILKTKQCYYLKYCSFFTIFFLEIYYTRLQ